MSQTALTSQPASPQTDGLRALVEYSRMLGADDTLVLRGGGNTSIKMQVLDVAGRDTSALCIKGSGSDLKSAKPEDFTLLRLDDLLLLRHHEDMSDDAMVDFVTRCKLDPAAPRPSIETLLHAFLPNASVFHSHADSILALTNTTRPRELLKEVFGNSMAIVPYRRPGFLLAREVADAAEESGALAVVLLNHGLVTWGDSPAAAYATHIEMVRQALEFAQWRANDRIFVPPLGIAPSREVRRATAAKIAPVLRGALCKTKHVVLAYDDADETLDFVSSGRARAASRGGAATPDHILTTKTQPLWIDVDSVENAPEAINTALQQYREDYLGYVMRHRTTEPVLDPNPRVILIPGIGMFTSGRTRAAAELARDIYRHTMIIMERAEQLGGYRSLDEPDAFAAEYWPLELYKLTLAPPDKELAGRIALVTGAGSGIGRAAALALSRAGAHVVITDSQKESAEATSNALPQAMSSTLDVTSENDIERAFAEACLQFGGIDVVVSNAGFAHCAPIEQMKREDWERSFAVNSTGHMLITKAALRLFRQQNAGGNIVFVASKNVTAAGADFAAYSAAKAAEAQLARVAAIEGAALGVRVNMVNPDAVFSGTHLWDEIRDRRAATHGTDPAEIETYYRKRSLLGLEVLPEHVAEAILFLASDRSSRTTGCMIPVDSGVREAFPR